MIGFKNQTEALLIGVGIAVIIDSIYESQGLFMTLFGTTLLIIGIIILIKSSKWLKRIFRKKQYSLTGTIK